MSDIAQSSGDVAREAKALSQGLRDLIKASSTWGSDVDFQRKKLRALYLKLLLLFPFSRESKDVETNLWMQTSYLLISHYKQRITALDRALYTSHGVKPRQGSHQDYHKLLNRFRQFLAEELKFYDQLLVRFVKQFGLEELLPVLSSIKSRALNQEQVSKSEVARNQFPPDDGQVVDLTLEQREAKLATWSKLLVCMGDIERYREQYNDSEGRPRAGHEEGAPRKPNRGGKNGTGHEVIPRPRNYSKAKVVYEQARRVTPDDGNASHQLAILASYQKDVFASVLHYYRSVCVRSPYDPASENLAVLLRKALEQYAASRDRPAEPANTPRKRVDRFKEAAVVLHGIWVVDTTDSAQSRASRKSSSVVQDFSKLIGEALLPEQIVSDTVVLALGALWKQRMVKTSNNISRENKYNNGLESLMVKHILELTRSLMYNGVVQMAETPEDVQGSKDLSRHITVSLRRTIQGLRIMSKWLVSNFSYIESSRVASAATPEDLAETVNGFLKTYAEFFTVLAETFPPQQLPELRAPLEEDVFMNGFSPIKRGLFAPVALTEKGLEPGQSQVHPNEEYLMRISDLIEDARSICDDEKSSVKMEGNRFVFVQVVASTVNTPAITSPTVDTLASIQETHPNPPRIHDSDDETTTQATRTEDDVIAEALRETVDRAHDEEDNEEMIVFNPRIDTLNPVPDIPVSASPQPPSSKSIPEMVSAKQVTASDLLNNLLGKNKPGGMHSPLFSGGTIWSTGPEMFTHRNVLTGSPALQRQPYSPAANTHGRSQSLSNEWSTGLHSSAANQKMGYESGLMSTPYTNSGVLGYPNVHQSYSSLHSHAMNDGLLSHAPMHGNSTVLNGTQEGYPIPAHGFDIWGNGVHHAVVHGGRPNVSYQWGKT